MICIRLQEKVKKKIKNGVVEGFSPLIVADFYADDFGWEVNRWLHHMPLREIN